MEISRDLIPIFGPIAAACIAGAIAFIASVFTKENKTSEFRQAWIEGLRNDVAELASLYHHITSSTSLSAKAGMDTDQFISSLKQEFLKIELMQARIELRLNPDEHRELIAKLRGTLRFEGIGDDDVAAHTRAVESFLSAVQLVLRAEWKRVKSGEPAYRITKWGSLVIFGVAAIVAILLATGYIHVGFAP